MLRSLQSLFATMLFISLATFGPANAAEKDQPLALTDTKAETKAETNAKVKSADEKHFSRMTDSKQSSANVYVSPNTITEDISMQPGSSASANANAKSLGGQEALQIAANQNIESSDPAKHAAKELPKKPELDASITKPKTNTLETGAAAAKQKKHVSDVGSAKPGAGANAASKTSDTGAEDIGAEPKVDARAINTIKTESKDDKILTSEAKNDSDSVTSKPELQALADLEILEFVLADKIENREPRNSVDGFTSAEERGFAFARLNAKSNSKVTFVWYRNGHEYARSTLPVNASKKWRTYSSVKLRPGDWKVQLLAEDKVLAEKTFTLQAESSPQASSGTQQMTSDQ